MAIVATASTSSLRESLDTPESNAKLNKANEIISRIENAGLNISSAQARFEQKISEFTDYDQQSFLTARKSPGDIAREVEAQITFLRKLKFNYIEQNAKDKYIKTIVDDDSQIVTLEDNESLRRSNEAKKARLKDAKERLSHRYKEVEELSKRVDSKHQEVQSVKAEFQRLTKEILDARLAISRLRTAHPHPRMTVAAANARLEEQTDQMAALDAQVSDNAARTEKLKNAVQDTAREVERLKVERVAKEEEAKQLKAEEEDERVLSLYDWYTASLALHRSLFSLQDSKLLAENELALTYSVTRTGDVEPVLFTLTLLFHPNSRRLADASVKSPDPNVSAMNFTDVIGSHVQSSDTLGLIRAVTARIRAGQ